MIRVAAQPILTPVVEVEIDGERHCLYALQPKQLEFYSQTPLRRVDGPGHLGYGGAAGGAKSHTARAIAASVALSWPGSTTILFRRTKPEIWNNHWVRFREEVPSFGGRLYTAKADAMELTWFNGSRTLFGYLERDEHVFRYIGNEYDCMIFEEATQQSWFQVNWLTSNRLRASTEGTFPFAVYLTNPGGPGHFWFKRLFVDRKFDSRRNEDPKNYVFVQAKVWDNAILLNRDPGYLLKLESQPEPYRSWYLEGDFSKGAGQALNLTYDQHLIEPFMVPDHWTIFRSFDWGFSHPFSFGIYAHSGGQQVWKLETITGRRLHDPEIVDRIAEVEETLPCLEAHRKKHKGFVSASYTVAGHDCWSDYRSKVENLPTTAETFGRLKYPLMMASISRVAGLKNFREYVHFSEDEKKPIEPRFRWFSTENNERCFEQCQQIMVDPDHPEAPLKRDADEFGEDGDDLFDETRYGLASRPISPKTPPAPPKPGARHYDDKLERLTEAIAKQKRRKRAPL